MSNARTRLENLKRKRALIALRLCYLTHDWSDQLLTLKFSNLVPDVIRFR